MRISNYILLLTAVLTWQVTAALTSNENSAHLPVVDLGYVSTF